MRPWTNPAEKKWFPVEFFLFSLCLCRSPSSFQTRAVPCRTTTMTNRCLWIVLTWLFRDVNEENIISEQNQHALSLPLVYLLFTCSHMFSKSTSAGHQLTPKSSAALYRIDLPLVPSAWPTGIRQTRSPIMQSRAEQSRKGEINRIDSVCSFFLAYLSQGTPHIPQTRRTNRIRFRFTTILLFQIHRWITSRQSPWFFIMIRSLLFCACFALFVVSSWADVEYEEHGHGHHHHHHHHHDHDGRTLLREKISKFLMLFRFRRSSRPRFTQRFVHW